MRYDHVYEGRGQYKCKSSRQVPKKFLKWCCEYPFQLTADGIGGGGESESEPVFVLRSKPWKIRLPLLILHKDLEKCSYRVGSDAVITQDILENKSEQPVRTSRASWLTTTKTHGRIRHPPTWRTEYYTTATTN